MELFSNRNNGVSVRQIKTRKMNLKKSRRKKRKIKGKEMGIELQKVNCLSSSYSIEIILRGKAVDLCCATERFLSAGADCFSTDET